MAEAHASTKRRRKEATRAKAQGLSALLLATPESFQRLLVRDWLDSITRRAWSHTCKAGEAQVWQHTPQINMQLTLHGKAANLQLLQATNQKLQRWGLQLHRLTVNQASGFPHTGLGASRIPAQLRHLQISIQHLTLSDVDATPRLLRALAKHLPDLPQLSLSMPPSDPVPSDAVIPGLRHLQLWVAEPDNPIGMGPYMTQLTSLTYDESDVCSDPGSLLALLSITSHSLRHLDFRGTPLSDTLVDLITEHLPALQTLVVAFVGLSRPHKHTRWALQRLVVNYYMVFLREVLYLPSVKDGEVLTLSAEPELDGPAQFIIAADHLEMGLSELADGLSKVRVQGCVDVCLEGDRGNPCHITAAQFQVVCDVLQWLGEPRLEVKHVLLEDTALDSLAQVCQPPSASQAAGISHPLPSLPCVHIITQLDWPECDLDDRVLSVLLHCAPQLKQLEVAGVSLKTGANSNRTWQLRKLTVKQPLRLSAVPLLPKSVSGMAGTAGVVLHLETRHMVCDATLDQAFMGVSDRVSTIVPVLKTEDSALPFPHDLALSSSADLPHDTAHSALALALTLLLYGSMRHHRVQRPPQPAALPQQAPRLRLESWTITQGLMEALSKVPSCFCGLHFDECLWLLPPSAYQPLFDLLPRSVKSVQITPRPSLQHIKGICVGGRGRQMRLGLPVDVALSAVMANREWGKHVSIYRL